MTLQRNAYHHGIGEIGSRFPLIALEFLLARLLGPATYGLWSILQTIIQYGNFLHFGTVSSLSRREPGLHVEGKTEEIKALRSATYGFQILVVLLVFFVSVCVVMVLRLVGMRYEFDFLIPALILTVFLQQVQITQQSSAINNFRFTENSQCRILFSVMFFVLGIASSRLERPLFWLLMAWSGALLCSVGLLLRMVPEIRSLPRFDLLRSVGLVKDGFPIFFQGLLRLLLTNIDKLAMWYLAPAAMLGVYALGTLTAGVCAMMFAIIGRVSLPTLLRQKAGFEASELIAESIEKTFRLAIQLAVIVALGVGAFAPVLITLALPAYVTGYWSTTILACAGVFLGLAQVAADIMLSFGVKRKVVLATIYALIAMLCAVLAAWFMFREIEAIAIATFLVFVGYSVFLCFSCFCTIGLTLADSLKRTRKSLRWLPIFVIVAVGVTLIQLILIDTLHVRHWIFWGGNIFLLLGFTGLSIKILRPKWLLFDLGVNGEKT